MRCFCSGAADAYSERQRPRVYCPDASTVVRAARRRTAVLYVESFNGKLRDVLLNGELFYTLHEAQVIVEGWRQRDNTRRPHSALGYRPPAPETRTFTPISLSA